MQVQLEETGQFGRKMSVTVPAPEVDKAFDAVVREVGKHAQVPGFRPGKVPKSLLEKQFAERIRGEVRERLVEGSLFPALQEQKVAPVAPPHLHLGSLDRGTDFSYTAEFEIQPEAALQTYKGLKVEKIASEVTSEEVDAEVDTLRKQAAQLVPVLVRDTAEDGDTVLVDYEGTMGGIPFEGGTAQGALIEVGAEGYLKEFSDGLRGARVPGERVIEVDFPADYPVADLAGKPATFKVQLRELKKKELPPLDDEFAKDVGEESLDALKAKIQERLSEHKKHEALAEQKKKLLEVLVAANPFDLPRSMVEQQAERMVASARARVERMVGQKVPMGGEELQKLKDDNLENAEFQVRSSLLLLKVAETEKLEVDKQDIDDEIERMAKDAGEYAARVRAAYGDPEMRQRLGYRVLEDKTVDFLLNNAEQADSQ